MVAYCSYSQTLTCIHMITSVVAADQLLLEGVDFSQTLIYLQAFGAVALGSLGGMAFPAISSIKANNVADSEQGTIQVCSAHFVCFFVFFPCHVV